MIWFLEYQEIFLNNNIFGVFEYRRYRAQGKRKVSYVQETRVGLGYKRFIDRNGYKKCGNIDKRYIYKG